MDHHHTRLVLLAAVMELGHQVVEPDLDLGFGQELLQEGCWDTSLETVETLVGAMVDLPGVARTAVDPTLVDGEVGGALVVVGGALPQGEAVDPAHEPLQDLAGLAGVDSLQNFTP